MKTKLALAITSALALTACVDDYELTSEGDNFHSVGSVVVTGDTTTGETLTATITDYDGFSADAVTYTWYKDNAPSSNSASTYVLTDADIDSVFSVKVEYVDNAGYSEVAISEFTEVVEEIAVQSPGSVAIEADSFFVGSVLTAVITDENGTSDSEITYVWKADGVAIEDDADDDKFLLTDAQVGAVITVLVSYEDEDGFLEEDVLSNPTVEVTEKPADVVESQVAVITDTFTDKAGQLRAKLTDASTGDIDDPDGLNVEFLEVGKLSVSFQKDIVKTTEGASKDAYIAIYGTSTSTNDAILDLKINDTGYAIRAWDSAGEKSDIVLTTTHTPGDWVDVDIVWDATSASSTVGPVATVFIDGEEVYTGTSTSSALTTFESGVQSVQFKLADSGSTPDGSFRVDNLKVYSDKEGTAIAFEDDFESYTIDDSLSKTDSTSGAGYNSNTFGAFVENAIISSGDTGTTTPAVGGQALSLTDETDSSSGQAKFPLTAATEKGKLTISFYKEPSQGYVGDVEQDEKDAYIGLYTASGSNKNAIIDLRLHGAYQDGGTPAEGKTEVDYGTLEQRNGSGLELDPAVILTATDSSIVDAGTNYNQGVNYTLDKWHELVMEWDATSTTDAATVTVTLDGVEYPSFASASVQGVTEDAVTNLIMKFGDTSRNTKDAQFHIDDIKVYSIDSEGVETLDLDYNFDSETLGEAPAGATTAIEAVITKRTL